MKRILPQILKSIANFFNRISDQEAEKVIKLYNCLFESLDR